MPIKTRLTALLMGLALVPYPVAASPSGPAAEAVTAYLGNTRIECYTSAGEGRCPISAMQSGVAVHYGKPAGGPALAVAFVDYQYDATGNAMNLMAIVLRSTATGWVPVGMADDLVGSSPRDVRFTPGSITYVGTVLGPDESRSDPKGRGTFRIAVSDKSVSFAGAVRRTPGAR